MSMCKMHISLLAFTCMVMSHCGSVQRPCKHAPCKPRPCSWVRLNGNQSIPFSMPLLLADHPQRSTRPSPMPSRNEHGLHRRMLQGSLKDAFLYFPPFTGVPTPGHLPDGQVLICWLPDGPKSAKVDNTYVFPLLLHQIDIFTIDTCSTFTYFCVLPSLQLGYDVMHAKSLSRFSVSGAWYLPLGWCTIHEVGEVRRSHLSRVAFNHAAKDLD